MVVEALLGGHGDGHRERSEDGYGIRAEEGHGDCELMMAVTVRRP